MGISSPRRSVRLKLVFAALCSLFVETRSFYLPGVTPQEYRPGDDLEVKAVKMTSIRSQLPFEYYSLPFCKSTKGIQYKAENLGEVLRGDRIVNTAFKVSVLQDVTCQAVCSKDGQPIKIDEKQSKLFYDRIQRQYMLHMLLDNLPAATRIPSIDDPTKFQYDDGFSLGLFNDKKAYLNNHLDFIVYYHQFGDKGTETEAYRIVGFEVSARSVHYDKIESDSKCTVPKPEEAKPKEILRESANDIYFTYSVKWLPSEIKWASRWDIFLEMGDVQIHWFSIVNSLVIVLFLSGIVAMIMVRTLRRDIAQYNRDEDAEEAIEETGWKLVHGDVFRPPQYPIIFTSFIGSGVQILSMTLVVLVLAMFGMLSPASRGALMSASIVLYAFMGIFSGFYAGRLYKTMKGIKWKKAAWLTGSLYPSLVLGLSFFMNFFIWGKKSSGAVPITTMIALLCIFFGICLPFVMGGFYFGFRKQAYDHPVRTNQIPRQVPEQIWYLNPMLGVLVSGILPFGAVFIELFFIFSAIWENQFYYLFGILFLVFIILLICCSEITIVLIYFQLCGEDYHWWWRSFFLSGGCSIYVFLYSIYYFYSKLEITEFVPALLYFTYSSLMVATFWLLTGTIGFFATYYFIRQIYGAVKID
ncbi:transmembrane 9 superfamily member 4-like [Oscarella lobularis]|uniref:transmembrane 9 superfamily member 4-like n=1 Tax=Oscarella lobularis TaxID=121494 RepID=UPI003313265F